MITRHSNMCAQSRHAGRVWSLPMGLARCSRLPSPPLGRPWPLACRFRAAAKAQTAHLLWLSIGEEAITTGMLGVEAAAQRRFTFVWQAKAATLLLPRSPACAVRMHRQERHFSRRHSGQAQHDSSCALCRGTWHRTRLGLR